MENIYRRNLQGVVIASLSGVLIAEECFNNPNDIYYQNLYDNTQYCAFGCCENTQGYKFCCSYVGPVIGIVAGVAFVVALVIIAICCVRRYSRQKKAIVIREATEFQRQRSLQKDLARSRESFSDRRSKSESELSYTRSHDDREYRYIDERHRRSYRRDDRRRPRSERDYSERYHSDESYSDYEYDRRGDDRRREYRHSSRDSDRRPRDHRRNEYSYPDRGRHYDRERRNGVPSYYSESRRSGPPPYRENENDRGSTRSHSRRERNERY